MNAPTTLAAVALAPAAKVWLEETDRAHVLNVFERACNLVNEHGHVLAIVTSERALTPFALVVAADQPELFRPITETSPVRVEGTHLWLGPLDIDFSAARVWPATPDWPAIRQHLKRPDSIDELARLALGHGPAGSLLELYDPNSPAGALSPMLRDRARGGAQDLVAGLRSALFEQAMTGARRLAGAGGGLTPAGDDFVLGALLAAWAGLYSAGALALVVPIAEEAAQRTTTLSGAYLRAAARGECAAYWHTLFDAIGPPGEAGLPAALSGLLSVGHTSGADALAGFLAGAQEL